MLKAHDPGGSGQEPIRESLESTPVAEIKGGGAAALAIPEPLHFLQPAERDFFIDNLLVRIQMIWWTGLAPWEFDVLCLGSLTSTFLAFALPEPLHFLQPAHRGKFL